MKRLILTLWIIAICSCANVNVHANTIKVDGLQENYDKLWMNYYTDIGISETIKTEYNKHVLKGWETYMAIPQSKREQYGYNGTLEEQKEQFMNQSQINFDKGFCIWFFNSEEYLTQYSQNNIAQYLIASENYWAIPYSEENEGYPVFKENGEIVITNYDNISEHIYTSFVVMKEGRDYLYDIYSIENSLAMSGINKVDDMKIMILNQDCTTVYICSNGNEYFIRIYDSPFRNWAPEFEMFKVYKASDAINLIANSTGLMSETKETFEAEALSLQSQGLLKGNERGLDLLKPLTRIEAVTMLLRAIGQEPAAATIKETFADVPVTHWGCAAAVKAEELGIVNGVGDNLFAPDKRVTATEFSTMVLRAAQETDFDWTQALNTLIETGIITEEDTEEMSLFTRGDMAKIIYEARNKGLLK